MAIILDESNFKAEVLESERTVLLDFYADWCGPCKMLAPILDEIAAEHPEIKVCKVNVDNEPALAASFSVMSIPALFVIKGGEVVNQSVGAKPKNQILAMLQ